jgi:hypothetical protein
MRYLYLGFFLVISCGIKCQTSDSRISMARINVNRNVDITLNGKVIAVLKPNDDFIYDFESHKVYLKNKFGGGISNNLVERTDKPFLKFTFSETDFKIDEENELLDLCMKHKINNIQSIIDSIVHNKSESKLIKYWDLHDIMDGAAAEMYYNVLFNLINSWSDIQLYSFLKHQNETFLRTFCNTLTLEYVTWPITKIDEYYNNYYPKSWNIIKKYK